jgi:hypothetical protein
MITKNKNKIYMLVLETTIKKEEKVTKTIPMPYYCYNAETKSFFKVLNEDSAIEIYTGISKRIGVCPVWLNKSEIAAAKEITEYEFEQALNQALDTIKAAALNTEVVS